MVERLVRNQKVASSSLVSSRSFLFLSIFSFAKYDEHEATGLARAGTLHEGYLLTVSVTPAFVRASLAPGQRCARCFRRETASSSCCLVQAASKHGSMKEAQHPILLSHSRPLASVMPAASGPAQHKVYAQWVECTHCDMSQGDYHRSVPSREGSQTQPKHT